MYAGKDKEKEFNTANKKEKEGKQLLGQSDGGRGVVEPSGNEMGHLHLAGASAPPAQSSLLRSGRQRRAQHRALTDGFRLLDSDALAISAASGETFGIWY